jgi:hypothetical protein
MAVRAAVEACTRRPFFARPLFEIVDVIAASRTTSTR